MQFTHIMDCILFTNSVSMCGQRIKGELLLLIVNDTETKTKICGNGDAMCILCNRRVVFLHKVASPTTGLAWIIQHFSRICVNRDNFDNVVACTQKTQKENLFRF